MARPIKGAPAFAAAALALVAGACSQNPMSRYSWGPAYYANLSDRDCMARAMYFESIRSSEEGMKAVGTVVMNRLRSGRYGGSICGIVGAPRQFAPGVLSKPVSGASWALAQRSADSVLRGERHARVGNAMHFHTAGYTFPYRNMAYVVAAGGNVFYEKRTPGTFQPVNPNVLVAEARERPRPSEAILLARAEEQGPVARVAEEAPVARRPAPIVLARAEEPVPILRRPAPVKLATLEDRAPTAREMRAAPRRPSVVRRELDEDEAPRARAKPERIRLAHLDDADMPKALRQRSDAAPQGPLGGTPLAYRTKPSTTDAKKAPEAKGSLAQSSPRPPPRLAAKIEATKPATTKTPGGKLGGEPLPYREAKNKAAAPMDPAKFGWKKGAQPVLAPNEKAKKRS